jgi:16S rRNA (guanine527-N7)-methyltransferase
LTDPLDAQLERARDLGFLGPGPIAGQRAHAEAFLAAVGDVPMDTCVDLGSGGGLPGLVLATACPSSRWVLVDSMQRRTAFLEAAVAELGLSDRVEVRAVRAEAAARDPGLRATAAVVVARGFGPPAVTAECGAPLLRVGGVLVVSEPPESEGHRWPPADVAVLGLGPPQVFTGPPALIRLCLERLTDARYPRRVGVPRKRPLW